MLRILIITLITLLAGCTEYKKPQVHRFVALNTTCSITIYTNKKVDLSKVEEIVRDFEEKVSFHLDSSQIAEINRNSGDLYTKVDPEIAELIVKAINYSDISNGYFDPTIGPLSKLWGVGTKNYLPEDGEITEVLKKVNYKKIEIEGDKIKLLAKGMELDLGGIAKGYISDIIKDFLISKGVKSAIINLGGNISLIGDKKSERPWRVGIQSPAGVRGVELGILEVSDVNVISSGAYERNFTIDGEVYHHIFNPFTGYPKEGEIVASTIISEYGVDGDALSTITFGSSLEEVLILRDELHFEGVFILKDDSVYVTEKIKDSFNLKHERYRLIEDY